MARWALKSLAFQAKAPAGQTGQMSKTSNPANHMRPAGGGAFILPSVVGAPATDVVQSQTCDIPFERAMECEADHREPVSLAKRTNRPSELGANAERSTTRRTAGERSGRALTASKTAPGDGSACGGKSAACNQAKRSNAAPFWSSPCCTPIIGASFAT